MTDPWFSRDQPTGRSATVFVAPGVRPPAMGAELPPGRSFSPMEVTRMPSTDTSVADFARSSLTPASEIDVAQPAAYVPTLARAAEERAKEAATERARARAEGAERMAAILARPQRVEARPVWPWAVGGALAFGAAALYFWPRRNGNGRSS
jgi:hypothetical protein